MPEKNKGGRPRKKISKDDFEKLCSFQCTKLEICGHLDVTDCTLEKWCKETYGKGFSEVFALKRSKGKISLRRAQFQMALTNPTMAIWLGKQYLDQRDKQETVNEIKPLPFIVYQHETDSTDEATT